jgi:hypothetical protein
MSEAARISKFKRWGSGVKPSKWNPNHPRENIATETCPNAEALIEVPRGELVTSTNGTYRFQVCD